MANDIIIKESSCSVDTTVQKIKGILAVRNLNLFSVTNHQKNAASTGVEMNESQLVVFGNPKLGTSIMNKDMTVGLDLPMKVLVYKDKDNKVKMAFRDGTWLAKEHSLTIPKRMVKMNKVMNMITDKAGRCKKD
jgi:uncharacterized protein (DUF302 family)